MCHCGFTLTNVETPSQTAVSCFGATNMLICNFTFPSFDVWLKISIGLTHMYSHQHSISNSGLSLCIRQFVETLDIQIHWFCTIKWLSAFKNSVFWHEQMSRLAVTPTTSPHLSPDMEIVFKFNVSVLCKN